MTACNRPTIANESVGATAVVAPRIQASDISPSRFGEGKYGFLGRVYEIQDYNPPQPGTLARLRAIIDEAFGRSGTSATR